MQARAITKPRWPRGDFTSLAPRRPAQIETVVHTLLSTSIAAAVCVCLSWSLKRVMANGTLCDIENGSHDADMLFIFAQAFNLIPGSPMISNDIKTLRCELRHRDFCRLVLVLPCHKGNAATEVHARDSWQHRNDAACLVVQSSVSRLVFNWNRKALANVPAWWRAFAPKESRTWAV